MAADWFSVSGRKRFSIFIFIFSHSQEGRAQPCFLKMKPVNVRKPYPLIDNHYYKKKTAEWVRKQISPLGDFFLPNLQFQFTGNPLWDRMRIEQVTSLFLSCDCHTKEQTDITMSLEGFPTMQSSLLTTRNGIESNVGLEKVIFA